MAVAEAITAPVPTPPLVGVVLTLTYDEAVALRALCGSIAGRPEGRRGIFHGREGCIASALASAGIPDEVPHAAMAGYIAFDDA